MRHFGNVEDHLALFKIFHPFIKCTGAFKGKKGMLIGFGIRSPVFKSVHFLGYRMTARGNDQIVILIFAFFTFNFSLVRIHADNFIQYKFHTRGNEVTFGFLAVFSRINSKRNKKPSRLIVMHFIIIDNSDFPVPAQLSSEFGGAHSSAGA